MATTTSRTLVYLRRLGYQAGTVEQILRMNDLPQKAGRPGRKWSGPPVIRRDLWGFADVLACHPVHKEMLLVQCTDITSVANHLTKAKQRQELAIWLKAGGKFEVWGWRHVGDRWQVRRVAVTGQELTTVLTSAKKRGLRNRRQRGLFD